jgi:chorismate mutase
MFLMRFTERAYVNYTEEDVKNSFRSAVRLTFQQSFDPPRADLYHQYLDEYETLKRWGLMG